MTPNAGGLRKAVGAFGLICGAIVIWTVGNYGYASADDPSARWNIAFLFGVIAAGGLFGHMISVRIWPISKFWSVLIGVACAAALIINLSNSLGALAGRNSRSSAEIASKTSAVKDDRAELARLQKALDKLGTYVATDHAAVDAAKRALDAASTAKERECVNGDPKQRGRNCLGKEADEKTAADTLTKATAAKALTDRASKIENDMRPIRDRLRTAGPMQEVNVQGNALAQLFRLPDAEAQFAVTLQQFALAGVVEVLIVLSMVAFELLGRDTQQQPLGAHTQRPAVPATEDQRARIKTPPGPRLVAATGSGRPAGSVAKILTGALEPAAGDRVRITAIYNRYVAACAVEGKPPLPQADFGGSLTKFCDNAGIETSRTGNHIYLLDVRLTESVDDRQAAT